VSLFQWCRCGDLRTLTDPMGRTTTWRHDVQGRVKCKEYADGSKVTYRYENSTRRLRQKIDEKLQVTQYSYNRDDTVSRISYTNVGVVTPSVAFTYDPNYNRLSSMTDGTGTTHFGYIPITPTPSLGAGQLVSVDRPLPDDGISFSYDEVGRRIRRAINGVASSVVLDAANRVAKETNPLGTFDYTYDGASRRPLAISYPNGQITGFSYLDNLSDGDWSGSLIPRRPFQFRNLDMVTTCQQIGLQLGRRGRELRRPSLSPLATTRLTNSHQPMQPKTGTS
jgi:YD repeat-containing protein